MRIDLKQHDLNPLSGDGFNRFIKCKIDRININNAPQQEKIDCQNANCLLAVEITAKRQTDMMTEIKRSFHH
jgi:hypothetical protein